uniref:PD-(D/E)XK motif protein n=1 Tax=Geobacter metallireducens TaxID=28232 RepID=A0A831XLR8_GEOME
MVQQTESESLNAAWRALKGDVEREGWRTIAVAGGTRCRILAGRHFPGNEEAIIVGLSVGITPSATSLPAGNGFIVKILDLGVASAGCVWFGLVRQPAGRLDFFEMMAEDIVATIIASGPADDERLLAVFLGRVRAWQSFMERDSEGILGAEAEVGLHGELVVLKSILAAGVNVEVAVQAWCGPLDGLHDFRFPAGAIEVKATTSTGTFPATVSSLEQLDESMVNELFLAGVRLRTGPDGKSLAHRAEEIRHHLHDNPVTLAAFETRLLHAGFFPALAARYPRRFSHIQTTIHHVSNGFPRLTHASVPVAVRKARYEIDLDLAASADLPLISVLKTIGAL